MSLTHGTPPASTAAAEKQRESPPQAFEFTKRKRWADLLITELSEAILLVLSPAGKVWYCGAAVTELLGWRDDELVDGELVDLMNAEDRPGFRTLFAESIRARTPLLAYARLQCKHEFCVGTDYASRPREVLFELTGHPHALPDADGPACFFAVAKPYPSRNTAMLNTFLELKMENERLQQRLVQLRAQQLALDPNAPVLTAGAVPAQANMAKAEDTYYGAPGYEHALPSPMDGRRPSYDATAYGAPQAVPSVNEGDADLESQRKKVKRMHAAEQYVCVTCGRTDSPEWRKGPMGPKTLCNACGLRWAKKVRKDPDAEAEAASGSNVVF